jgi:recombination protein RecA
MSKKKKEDEIDDIIELKDSAVKKKLIKDHGDVFLSADFILGKKQTIIPVSPKLDIGLNGGIPTGTWGIISGKSKIGKSSMCLAICAKAQRPEYGSRKCYYFDIEHRLTKKNLDGTPGLLTDKDHFEVVTSTQGNILTAEKCLTIAETLLKNEPNIVIIIDSTSSLCTAKEYDSEMSATGRNEGPKLLAQFTRKLASVVPVQDSLVILIQHLIANTSGYGPAFMEDGGGKIIYQSDFKLRGTGFQKWEEDEKQVGQVNTWDIVFSALGQPGGKVESYFRFGYGIDELYEAIDLACDFGIIEKGGAWFTIPWLEEPVKIQGQKKVKTYLEKNPKVYTEVLAKIKEML